MKTVDEIMKDAFHPARSKRSREYIEGCRNLLNRKINGVIPTCPYEEGSASRDAYFAGVEEGWALWKENGGTRDTEHPDCKARRESGVLRV